MKFQLNGNTIRGWRWNHPAEKKVLIIHGFESTALNFDRYIKPLTRKGYEVLAFDAPAHGRSSGQTVTAPLYKQAIKEIFRQYGPIQAYMAHSFGGLALSLALEEMENNAKYRVVLIAPATETTTAIDSFFKFLKLDPSIRPEFEKIILRNGGVSSSWYSIRRAMKHIHSPVLWFHDDEDEVTPLSDVLKVREENYPNLQFVITTGLGHRRIYRDNNVTKAIVEFL